MINNGNNHVLHHVILYIEDVDLNTVYVSPLIGVPGHPLH